MSDLEPHIVTLKLSMRPGFALAVRLCGAIALVVGVVSPRLGRRFLSCVVARLPRLFCRIS